MSRCSSDWRRGDVDRRRRRRRPRVERVPRASCCRSIRMRTGSSTIASACSCAIGSSCAALAGSIELVALDPTDEHGHVGIMRDLLRAGDRTGVLRQFDVLAKILDEELGHRPEHRGVCGARPRARTLAASGSVEVSATTCQAPASRARPHLATQRVHFCTTTDGVRLAYASSGSGPPFVKASTWLTHLDYDWDSPVWRHWWQALSRRHTLVRYDERGCGLSDWDVDADSFTLDGVGARSRDGRRRARPRAVPVARHLAGRTDRRHLRRPPSRAGEPR